MYNGIDTVGDDFPGSMPGENPFLNGFSTTACGTFLTNAPGIFGAASAYRSARQLGHSVAIAERHYLGLLRGIPREAHTLDEAMGIEDLLDEIVARASGAPAKQRKRA